MSLTESMHAVSKYLEDLLEGKKEEIGLHSVFYGDQDRIPHTPTACIEPGEKRRQLNGAPRRTEVTITVYVLVYHNPVTSTQTIREENDKVAEAIETEIHKDAYMDGLVVDSMVTMIESGYQMRSNTLFRSSRLTIEARSQVQLPSSF